MSPNKPDTNTFTASTIAAALCIAAYRERERRFVHERERALERVGAVISQRETQRERMHSTQKSCIHTPRDIHKCAKQDAHCYICI